MKASHRHNAQLTWFRSGARPLAWQVAAALLTVSLLSGCVTEYSGGTQMTADPDATVDKRVS